jgi:hypothetical protein
VGQLVLPRLVVNDDGAQPRALDDDRTVAIECDADTQRARAVQELARERYRERELRVVLGRFGRGRQLGFFAESCPRRAPAGYFALWMLT